MFGNFSKKNKTTRSVRIVCGLAFVLFCTIFLYFQANLLEMLQKILSEGQTSYSAKWGTWIITLILCLIQVGVDALSRLPERFHALSYLPSLLLLAFLTDVDKWCYASMSLRHWIWILPLSFCLFAILVGAVRQLNIYLEDERSLKWPARYLPNLVILNVLCLGCISLSNTDELFHYEAAVDSALLDNDYTKALSVAEKSPLVSRELSVMRVYALSRVDSLPEKLFVYPYKNGAESLLFMPGEVSSTWLKPESVYKYLGDTPYMGETVIHYLQRLCYTEKGNEPALNYYLCALLLDKKLDLFVKELNKFCFVELSLPQAYKEALYLYYKQHSLLTPPFDMTELEQKYDLYSLSSLKEKNNYWFYYDHVGVN